MIRVELIESNGMHVSADVWGAEVIHNGSDCGVVVLHENLSPSDVGIPVTKGDTVVLYEPESQDIEMERVKVYGEKDVENLRSTINTFVFQKYYETIRNEGPCISFDKISEVCQPAYEINAMTLNESRDCICSYGENSLADKLGAASELGLVRNVSLNGTPVALIGGFRGMERVEFLTERNLHIFVDLVNRQFPD